MPKPSPWRSSGTCSAMNRLVAGWATEFATPATASRAMSTRSESAKQRCREQARGRDEHAGAQRPERSHALGQPAAEARAERPGEEEHGDAGRDLRHIDVEVPADLQREGPDEEAGQHGRRARGDRQREGTRERYASPTTFAITITPTTQRIAPITSNTAPAFNMRVIGDIPDE